jgi:hypothetical protein
MRYKNPTPNPLPASDEGAKMYLIRAETAVIIGNYRNSDTIKILSRVGIAHQNPPIDN